MERKELAEMHTKYDLQKEDFFKHKHYTIITRSGIEKIQAKEDITIRYEFIEAGGAGVILKAIATKGDKFIETFGSASKDTSHSKYYTEMAEKRAMSRAVLKMADLYKYGVFSEDEADDFKEETK
jgi:hypothetical protein